MSARQSGRRTWGSSIGSSRPPTGPTGVRFVGPSVAPAAGDSFVSWGEIHDDARVVGAALQARGLVPGDHVAILGPTSRQLITIIQGCWLAGVASMVLPLPMRMGSLDAFIESTRARIRHGDAKLRADRRAARRVLRADCRRSADRADGRGPARVADRAERRAAGDPGARPRATGDPAVHQRIDQRAEGRDDPRSGAGRQHRRVVHAPPSWVEARGDGLVAAAVPRHGSRRLPVDPDDQRRASSCRPRRRTSWPSPATGCSGSATAAARPRPARTSRGCWPPGRSGG